MLFNVFFHAITPDREIDHIAQVGEHVRDRAESVLVELGDPLLLVGDMRVIGGADECPLGGLVVEYDAEAPVEVNFADTGLLSRM